MIVALTGGTGGAKLIEGLAAEIDSAELTIICNTGDDAIFHGLHISPDIDTIIYTLAGLSESVKGWGIKDDTFIALEQLRRLGNDAWFNLGDKDLATHITRMRLLNEGRTLAEVTDHLRRKLSVRSTILPMSNQRIETRIMTPQGELSFQEFFVKEHWSREVTAVRFVGSEESHPAPAVRQAIHNANAIVVCPSNPITSIGPMLSVPGIRAALVESAAPVIAISPIIGKRAISGPADKLMVASGFEACALGVAQYYSDFLDILLIDDDDGKVWRDPVERLGIQVVTTGIRMPGLDDKRRLARELLALVRK